MSVDEGRNVGSRERIGKCYEYCSSITLCYHDHVELLTYLEDKLQAVIFASYFVIKMYLPTVPIMTTEGWHVDVCFGFELGIKILR